MLRLIGNLIWFIFGGVFMGLAWLFFGLIAFISIIGIPWGRSCFVIGKFMFWPFGREAVNRRVHTGRDDIGTGPLGVIGNIIWLVLAGLWLAIGHLIWAVALYLTIIGIPFGVQHVKLAGIALFPIGKAVVLKEVAEESRRINAELEARRMRLTRS